MKLKLYSMAIVFVLLLVGCNTGQGDMNSDNNNIEPTRYNDNNFNNRNNRDQGTGMRPDGTTNINNRNIEENRDNVNRENRYEISREAADRITEEIDEIDQAYVLTTDNNAYV